MIEGIIIFCALPILVFFCVKFGTVAYYKGKQFIEQERNANEQAEEKE